MPDPVASILTRYQKDEDFESARTRLLRLPPDTARALLELALGKRAKLRPLLVMVLADLAYPPSFPAMRKWLDDRDVENIALPAASALDAAAGGRFEIARFWSGGHRDELPAALRAIAAWWDAGVGLPSCEEEPWLTQTRERRARDEAIVPPPSPLPSREQRRSLDPDLVALRKAFDALPLLERWRIDAAGIRRALPLYAAAAGDVAILEVALDEIDRAIAGDEDARPFDHGARVTAAIERTNREAGYSPAHERYRVPALKAASHVAQGVKYALSSHPSCRLQPLHNARDALAYAGRGFDAIREELAWQLAAVRGGRSSS